MTLNRLFVSSSVAAALLGLVATANAQNAPEAAPPPPAEAAPPPAAAPTGPPPVAATSAPAARVTDNPGISISARLGYAIPMGSVASGANLSDGTSGGVPIVLEGAYRINRNLSAGLFLQYAYLAFKNCPSGASCSAADYRFGVEAMYDLRMEGPINPWFGFGIGYEVLTASASAGGYSADSSYTGFEYATISAGGNFAASPVIDVGPFVSFSLAQFSSATVNGTSGDITNTAMHQWLQLGVRGTFNL